MYSFCTEILLATVLAVCSLLARNTTPRLSKALSPRMVAYCMQLEDFCIVRVKMFV